MFQSWWRKKAETSCTFRCVSYFSWCNQFITTCILLRQHMSDTFHWFVHWHLSCPIISVLTRKISSIEYWALYFKAHFLPPLPLSLPPCRFLQVCPASVEDERLLVGIVAFLNAYFKQIHTESSSDPEDKDLRWILELLLNHVQIIYTFLASTKVNFTTVVL